MNALATAIHHENGDPEVSATWAAGHLDQVRLVDVREPHELDGPLGKVTDVENIPLMTLLADSTLDAEQPLLLLCRSGRRSARAARELKNRGIHTVASVEGGMLAWNTDVLGHTTISEDERVSNAANLDEASFRTNGVPEVGAGWVHANLGRFTFIDVREPFELQSNGAVPQATNVPLQQFMAEVSQDAYSKDLPLVVMCQSGGRSGRVVRALADHGFTHVASMEGGMFGWRARALPFARG